MMIRRAIAAELAALVNLVNSAYRGEDARAGWTSEAELLGGQRIDAAMLRSDIEAADRCTVLTLRENRGSPILGCVKLELVDDRVCHLGMLSVAPEAQAMGIGKRLLSASDEFARLKGATRMRITVIHVRDTLLAWYERHGYSRTGETEPFPYGDPRFGIPRRADLHFVVLEKKL
jgi:ribosomal protein S18 acetylase RimI-like enzyme